MFESHALCKRLHCKQLGIIPKEVVCTGGASINHTFMSVVQRVFNCPVLLKNKTIERLNEQFEFITGSTEKFIQTLKSKEDKRIQVIQLIKD